MKIRALTAATTGANSSVFRSNGSIATLVATGTFGGATLTVMVEADDAGPTYAGGEFLLSAVGTKTFTLPRNTNYRLSVTAGAGVAIDAWLHFNQ